MIITFQFVAKNHNSANTCPTAVDDFTFSMPLLPCFMKGLVAPQRPATTISHTDVAGKIKVIGMVAITPLHQNRIKTVKLPV